MTKKTIKTGAESIKWDLSPLFKGINDPNIPAITKKTKAQAAAFEKKHKNKINGYDSKKLKHAFNEFEKILTPFDHACQYAQLLFSENTQNNEAKALLTRLDEAESEIRNTLLFFDLEVGQLSSKKIQAHLKSPHLKNYAYYIAHTHKTAKFALSEKEEKWINIKNLNGENALKKLYDELTASFSFELKIDGRIKKLTPSECRALRHHPDKTIRKNAMQTFFAKYKSQSITLTAIYNHLTKDYNLEAKLRGYKNAIAVRNTQNDINDKTIAILHDVTTASYPLVHRYYRLKAKLLQLPNLNLADIYAPIPEVNKHYTWNEAKDLVLSAYAAFDNELYVMAKKMFDDKKIHATIQPGKQGGAFCSSSTPIQLPYVLINFLGKEQDVATLAHELGHAIHNMLCAKQTLINYHPVLPFAETASVFGEMLVTDLLLKKETSKQIKIAILSHKLEDIFATSHRQNMLSRFEMSSHKLIQKELLSAQALCELYQHELKLMFGNSVCYLTEYDWEWATIPHIFEWPFYVYAYNFANLFVLALYQQYQEEGTAFTPKFKALLSSGRSQSPQKMADVIGKTFHHESFWKKSIAQIERMITMLENLINDNA